ncbi:nuclear transport factor 2 family protein [Phytohabitans kaempferiae]|uniref:Nuclear transport factor 2 family protein n=1 Tax=Phytohabitans kaempferiae TaxID=1620943 RepID=A0ABV6MH47_9ACTN
MKVDFADAMCNWRRADPAYAGRRHPARGIAAHGRARARDRAQLAARHESGPAAYKLRVTTIFRREDGAWKVVHRHGDRLAPA